MKLVINGKNNLCIPQKTSKTLFCYCLLVVEIFQQFRHTESCVRKFFVPVKYVINEKNHFCIPQRARKTLFYRCSRVVKIFQQIGNLENCVRKNFVHSITV